MDNDADGTESFPNLNRRELIPHRAEVRSRYFVRPPLASRTDRHEVCTSANVTVLSERPKQRELAS